MLTAMRKTTAALIASAVLALPAPGIADVAEDEAAIRAIWETYSSSRVAGDAETWLGLWDNDITSTFIASETAQRTLRG